LDFGIWNSANGIATPRQVGASMYENAAVCQGARIIMLFSTPFILFGHLSLEAVSPDACIRPSQGMSIFPEVSHSMNEHTMSHASLAHTSLATRDFLDGTGS